MSRPPAALLADATSADLPAVATLLVLSELARSDGDFDRREDKSIQRALSTLFSLEEARVAELIVAQADVPRAAADLAGLGRLLTQRLPLAKDRLAVVTAMWTVVLADGEVTSLEDRLASSMAMLLGVDFKRVDEIKAELQGT